MPASEPIISIEIDGQIDANKEALYALGYRWSDSTDGGLLGYLSMHRPKRALALLHKIDDLDNAKAWISHQQTQLDALGYKVTSLPSSLDMQYLAQLIGKRAAAKEKLEEIKKTDPRPATSPLTCRIREIEASANAKWNGKIYGRNGGYNFYVNNVNYKATDAEVAERESRLKEQAAWDSRYKDLIDAAK